MTAQEIYAAAIAAGITLTVNDGRVRYRGPEGSMTAELAAAIKTNRDEVIALILRPNRQRAQLTPTYCLGPSVCAVVGVCGRMACIPTDEALDWMDAAEAARLPTNPHRVPEFDQIEDEGAAAA